MNLSSYLNLYEVLESDTSTRHERRSFGLSHTDLKSDPEKQLLAWTESRKGLLKRPLLSETVNSYLYGITLGAVSVAFIFGLFSGVALLSYNGHEPVNVIYFMAMVIAVPLLTMTLTLFSMFRANRKRSMLVHISPAYWMEKLFALLPNKMEAQLKSHFSEMKISPLVANWLVIKRSQVVALAFSLGLLLALLAMVATRDIAFAWSTTLSISPESFHHLLQTLALPWRDLFPWAVPSLELVAQSQYYRLGEKLAEEMVRNASLLGEWWKFLLFATLFYAIILRFFMFLLSSFGLKRAIGRSFMALDGVEALLNDMNEPMIRTAAKEVEKDFLVNVLEYMRIVHTLDDHYDVVLGWALEREQLHEMNVKMSVVTETVYEVGGANSLQEDSEIIQKCKGDVLMYVKAWEPPTMDFIDFLEMLVSKVNKVTVMPVGTEASEYDYREKELNVWARKLSLLDSEKVWLKV